MGNSASSEKNEDSAGRRAAAAAAPAPPAKEKDPSYWQMAKQGYGELVNAIIRPPRAEYALDDLGQLRRGEAGVEQQRVRTELVERHLRLHVAAVVPNLPDIGTNVVRNLRSRNPAPPSTESVSHVRASGPP